MKREKKSIQFPATLDRIEGDIGVVYIGAEEACKIDLPLQYLPPGIKGGVSLKITIEEDKESQKKLKNRILNLQKDLLKE
jgi:hypothetical protein